MEKGILNINIKSVFCGLVLSQFLMGVALCDDKISIGIGVGAPYSGLGVNIALITDRDFKYVAVGCLAHYDGDGGKSGNACGAGVGWLRSDWIATDSTKHALGIYLGPVTSRRYKEEIRTEYGAGITYAYFLSGIEKPGLHLGLTPALYRDKGDTKGSIALHLGYQF